MGNGLVTPGRRGSGSQYNFMEINNEYTKMQNNGASDEEIFNAMKKTFMSDAPTDAFTNLAQVSKVFPTEIVPKEAPASKILWNMHKKSEPTKTEVFRLVDQEVDDNTYSTGRLDVTEQDVLDILNDPMGLKLFVESTPDRLDQNLLMFWSNVCEIKSLPSSRYTDRRLRKLYDNYMKEESHRNCAIPNELYERIVLAYQQPSDACDLTAGMFIPSQEYVYTQMEKRLYVDFLASSDYVQMCACHEKTDSESIAGPNPIPFTDLLHSTFMSSYVKSFAHSTKRGDSSQYNMLMMYLDVEDCKRLPNKSFTNNKMRKLSDFYLKSNAKQNIALKFTNGVITTLHMKASSGKCSSEELKPIFAMTTAYIQSYLWPSFAMSKAYLTLLQSKANLEVKSMIRKDTSAVVKDGEWDMMEVRNRRSSIIQNARKLSVSSLFSGITPVVESTDIRESTRVLLSDPVGRNLLKDFMNQGGYNLFSFYQDLEDFKILPGVEYMHRSAVKLYKKYVDPNCKCQVDMSDALRASIEVHLTLPSIDMFNTLLDHLKEGLLRDAIPRFVKSTYFASLLEEEPGVCDEIATLTGYPQLESVLRSSSAKYQFYLFLQYQHCAENLLMLESILEFQSLPSYHFMHRAAHKIYEKYLKSSGKVNVKKAMIHMKKENVVKWDEMKNALKYPTRGMFHDAEEVRK